MKFLTQRKNQAKDYIQERPFLRKLRISIKRYLKQDFSSNAAASCYFFIFSLFPLLLFVNSLVNIIYPNLSQDLNAMSPDLEVMIPGPILDLLQDFVQAARPSASASVLSITAIGLLWAASKGVGNIVNGLSKIYNEKREYNFLIQRVLGLIAILVVTLLLIAVIIILSFNQIVLDYLSSIITMPPFLLEDQFNLITYGAAFFVLSLIFTLIFHVLSRGKAYFRQSLLAGSFAAIGWLAISFGLQLFLRFSNSFSNRYGSISGIIFLMLWVYSAIYLVMLSAFIHSELIKFQTKPTKGKKANAKKEKETTSESQHDNEKKVMPT